MTLVGLLSASTPPGRSVGEDGADRGEGDSPVSSPIGDPRSSPPTDRHSSASLEVPSVLIHPSGANLDDFENLSFCLRWFPELGSNEPDFISAADLVALKLPIVAQGSYYPELTRLIQHAHRLKWYTSSKVFDAFLNGPDEKNEEFASLMRSFSSQLGYKNYRLINLMRSRNDKAMKFSSGFFLHSSEEKHRTAQQLALHTAIFDRMSSTVCPAPFTLTLHTYGKTTGMDSVLMGDTTKPAVRLAYNDRENWATTLNDAIANARPVEWNTGSNVSVASTGVRPGVVVSLLADTHGSRNLEQYWRLRGNLCRAALAFRILCEANIRNDSSKAQKAVQANDQKTGSSSSGQVSKRNTKKAQSTSWDILSDYLQSKTDQEDPELANLKEHFSTMDSTGLLRPLYLAAGFSPVCLFGERTYNQNRHGNGKTVGLTDAFNALFIPADDNIELRVAEIEVFAVIRELALKGPDEYDLMLTTLFDKWTSRPWFEHSRAPALTATLTSASPSPSSHAAPMSPGPSANVPGHISHAHAPLLSLSRPSSESSSRSSSRSSSPSVSSPAPISGRVSSSSLSSAPSKEILDMQENVVHRFFSVQDMIDTYISKVKIQPSELNADDKKFKNGFGKNGKSFVMGLHRAWSGDLSWVPPKAIKASPPPSADNVPVPTSTIPPPSVFEQGNADHLIEGTVVAFGNKLHMDLEEKTAALEHVTSVNPSGSSSSLTGKRSREDEDDRYSDSPQRKKIHTEDLAAGSSWNLFEDDSISMPSRPATPSPDLSRLQNNLFSSVSLLSLPPPPEPTPQVLDVPRLTEQTAPKDKVIIEESRSSSVQPPESETGRDTSASPEKSAPKDREVRYASRRLLSPPPPPQVLDVPRLTEKTAPKDKATIEESRSSSVQPSESETGRDTSASPEKSAPKDREVRYASRRLLSSPPPPTPPQEPTPQVLDVPRLTEQTTPESRSSSAQPPESDPGPDTSASPEKSTPVDEPLRKSFGPPSPMSRSRTPDVDVDDMMVDDEDERHPSRSPLSSPSPSRSPTPVQKSDEDDSSDDSSTEKEISAISNTTRITKRAVGRNARVSRGRSSATKGRVRPKPRPPVSSEEHSNSSSEGLTEACRTLLVDRANLNMSNAKGALYDTANLNLKDKHEVNMREAELYFFEPQPDASSSTGLVYKEKAYRVRYCDSVEPDISKFRSILCRQVHGSDFKTVRCFSDRKWHSFNTKQRRAWPNCAIHVVNTEGCVETSADSSEPPSVPASRSSSYSKPMLDITSWWSPDLTRLFNVHTLRDVHDMTIDVSDANTSYNDRMRSAPLSTFIEMARRHEGAARDKVMMTNYLDVPIAARYVSLPFDWIDDCACDLSSANPVWRTRLELNSMAGIWAILANESVMSDTHIDASGLCTGMDILLGEKLWVIPIVEEDPEDGCPEDSDSREARADADSREARADALERIHTAMRKEGDEGEDGDSGSDFEDDVDGGGDASMSRKHVMVKAKRRRRRKVFGGRKRKGKGIGKGQDPTTIPTRLPSGLRAFDKYRSYQWQAVYLRPGDKLFMPPGMPHIVLTLKDCLAIGGHYYNTAMYWRSLLALTWEHYFGAFITNTEHPKSPFAFFAALESNYLAFRSHNTSHTKIEDWDGFPGWEGLATLIVLVVHMDKLDPTMLKVQREQWQGTAEFANDFERALDLALELYDEVAKYGATDSLTECMIRVQARYAKELNECNSVAVPRKKGESPPYIWIRDSSKAGIIKLIDRMRKAVKSAKTQMTNETKKMEAQRNAKVHDLTKWFMEMVDTTTDTRLKEKVENKLKYMDDGS
ncbi:hypothetical protein DFH11DRAFT_1725722 [Phellopilus nigrolimitatus]|nr:hypothetical protein DFH11DRAFT_1725722 [Phellopilus nigrolimitatus]